MIPTNDDLTLVIGGWPIAEFDANRKDIEGNYLRSSTWCRPSPSESAAPRARRASSARPCRTSSASPTAPAGRWSATPATHKDFITAQGIDDAFRDAELCATALHEAFSGACSFDDAMARYQSTRDQHVLPMYEFTTQLATLEPPPPELAQLLAAAHGNHEAMDAFARVNAGVMSPAEFFSDENVERILAAAGTTQAS